MNRIRVIFILLMGMSVSACSPEEEESVPQAPLATIAGEDSSDEPRTAPPEIRISEGRIASIDAERKLIWVKLREGGDETVFRYTPATEVQGFGDMAEGLVDEITVDSLHDVAKGTTVRVHYRPDAELIVPYNAAINMAVKLELDRPL